MFFEKVNLLCLELYSCGSSDADYIPPVQPGEGDG